jgi:hypothetical protein
MGKFDHGDRESRLLKKYSILVASFVTEFDVFD